jgi:dTDP-4-dehydrorhamnose reductase
MRILLTGSSGQLGRALYATLRPYYPVNTTSHQEMDIVQLSSVRSAVDAIQPDLVINTAAYNNVDLAEARQGEAFAANARGPRNLAIVTAAAKIPLLHVSTNYVFDGQQRHPYHEFDQPRPLSIYGASKVAGEEAVRAHNPCHYIVRTAWLYHIDGTNFPNTIHNLALKSGGQRMRLVSDEYGSPTYAPHLAEAIARLITTRAFGTYHFAGNGNASWYEWGRALFEALNITIPVRPVTRIDYSPQPAKRPAYSVLATLQDPTILLPPWQEGIQDFATKLAERS